MTEAEWLTCQEPDAMVEWLKAAGKLSERKGQLFAVHCCRRVWHLLTDERSRTAVELAERHAEGLAGQDEVMAAWGPTWEAGHEAPAVAGSGTESAAFAAGHALGGAVVSAADEARYALVCSVGGTDGVLLAAEMRHQAALLRDLLGPLPFRPIPFDPRWRTPDVVALAKSIYESRRFEELPILADALEEAGADNQAILWHLRSPGPHVRGCFAVDAVLGKA